MVKKNNPVNSNPKAKAKATKPKTVTPKKYRKNFVVRIPRTNYKVSGPKRITLTVPTEKPYSYTTPTHTSEETTSYYSTYHYDFISPSPKPTRVLRMPKKSYLTSKSGPQHQNITTPPPPPPSSSSSIPITKVVNTQSKQTLSPKTKVTN